MNEIALKPEDLDIANAYLTYGSAQEAANQLQISEAVIHSILDREDVKRYITGVYLDRGFRNREKIGSVLDKMIESKLEEAEESEIYTNKDLFDLLTLAHKIRMDELKLMQQDGGTTVNVNNFGNNYNSLMDKLLK